MPCLTEQEMLIHSTKMETSVLILGNQLPRDCSRTSDAILGARRQSTSWSLSTVLVFLLGLLAVGIVFLITYMNIFCTCSQVRQKNVIENIEISGFKGNSWTYRVFNVKHNGSYIIYGKVLKVHSDCTDIIKLCLEGNNQKCGTSLAEAKVENSMAEIIAFDVQLEKSTEVLLSVNCGAVDEKKTFFKVLEV